jgi:deoxyribodipyrimidine photo-lyase
MRSLMWFREHDLRCRDNTALYYASQHADEGLLGMFIISPQEWHEHDLASSRIDFILRHLSTLAEELSTCNIPLLVIKITKKPKIINTLLDIAKRYQISKLFFNDLFEVDEQNRDAQIEKRFRENNIQVHRYIDNVILAPGEVQTKKGTYFTVFTPFKKAWIKCLQAKDGLTVLPKSKIIKNPFPALPLYNNSKANDKLWAVGEKIAHEKLKRFIINKADHYQQDRDFPAIDGTSSLSPYLTSGILSSRQCLQASLKYNDGKLDSVNPGVTTWISELIWREFYKHILFAFPRISMHRAFQLKTESIKWRNNKKEFSAWKNGQTGIPIIDAAMNQLRQTGWMHNRCRMIVAMFLSKNLLIDWRWGEKYFMQHLIDGDLSSNNGGWQWSASTGTDAAPYFRIFNPITQSKRFDPNNAYIKKYCPEAFTKDYPKPIVDLTSSRLRAIEAYKSALKHHE